MSGTPAGTSGDDAWLDPAPGTDDTDETAGSPEESASPDSSDASDPGPDGEIHARTQTDQVNEELQQENAASALDQPSDGSGGE
jgi:hypothetical protein